MGVGWGEDFECPAISAPGYLAGDSGNRVGEGTPLQEEQLLIAAGSRPLCYSNSHETLVGKPHHEGRMEHLIQIRQRMQSVLYATQKQDTIPKTGNLPSGGNPYDGTQCLVPPF